MKLVGHFVWLALCVLRYNVAGGQVITDQNAVLVKGSEASLQCSFRGTPLQLYWLKLGGASMSEAEPLIGWYNGRTQRPPNDGGKFNLSENFSLRFTADIGDAGRYYCDVSNDEGTKIGAYTDVTVSVPPSDPFPMIDNFMISDGNQRTTITCRADGASIGLVDLQWIHNGDEYPQINRNFTNADGTTENITATIEAQFSEEPYICVGTLKATKRVMSTDMAFVQRTIVNTISSKEPTGTVTTREATYNKDSTVNAVAVSVSILLVAVSVSILLAVTAFAVYICVKKKNLPMCLRRSCKTFKNEGCRQLGCPEGTSQQDANNGGSVREVNITLMISSKQ